MFVMPKLVLGKKNIGEHNTSKLRHLLLIPTPADHLAPDCSWPCCSRLSTELQRKKMVFADLAKTAIALSDEAWGMTVWVTPPAQQTAFERQVLLRKALMLLLEEQPEDIGIVVAQDHPAYADVMRDVLYVAALNGVRLPTWKTGKSEQSLKKIIAFSPLPGQQAQDALVLAEANTLARSLTMMPPNRLPPREYRRQIANLAEQNAWSIEQFDLKKLRKMGAGAFVAVAQGSGDDDAAIVHLRRTGKHAKQTVALVGKGICFDTGGHNIKPARYMRDMHQDMNGSAVALAILQAADALDLPVNLDVWLAIARNHVGPEAYTQNDVVTALNGTTIEIMHTDAEGRMVLADALTLAAREKPDQIIDFATLTGSMVTALGTRYSGVLGNRSALLETAVEIGQQSGERLCAFPLDADYDPALDSKVADVLQCTLDGEADHILAARFLQRFVQDIPWLHVDLSACQCKDGLGGVSTDVTGFGVAWGVAWLTGLIG